MSICHLSGLVGVSGDWREKRSNCMIMLGILVSVIAFIGNKRMSDFSVVLLYCNTTTLLLNCIILTLYIKCNLRGKNNVCPIFYVDNCLNLVSMFANMLHKQMKTASQGCHSDSWSLFLLLITILRHH